MSNCISLKGVKDGVEILLDETTPFIQIVEEIKAKLVEGKDFFGSAALLLYVKGRVLPEENQEKLAQTIHEILPSRTNIIFDKPEPIRPTAPAAEYITTPSATFVKGTVRSGQVIEADGDLIIAGDVNPGANVIAGEDLVVMGNLRGIVHAGVNGNRNAVVIALKVAPSQLRIADMITRAPDQEEKRRLFRIENSYKPEIAYIKDDTIYIDDYSPRKM